MKYLARAYFVITLLSVALLAGCASAPTIRVDKDPSADLSRYRTFGFYEPLGTDRQGYESLLSQRLKEATRYELERKGYHFDQVSPDLLVNFGARLKDRIRVQERPAAPFGYWSYRRGLYRPWAGFDETEVDQYTEGTLTIDLVDAKNKQLVWQGSAIGRVTEETLENVTAAVRGAVEDILAKLPGERTARY